MSGVRTLLLVEDQTDVRKAIRRVCEDAEIMVHEAGNGTEALRLLAVLAGSGALPGLIITDMEMPSMDGPTFIREMRKVAEYAAIPVIMCSANVMLEKVAADLGVECFSKGQSFVPMRARVHALLASG